MKMNPLVLTLDFGTQSLRTALIDSTGNIKEIVKAHYEPAYFSKEKGYAEQEPDFYWNLAVKCLKELAGVRASGVVSYKDYSCEGEIQFNKDSVSGYPIMCISRFIGFDELDKKLSDLRIDFIPYLSAEALKEELTKRFKRNPKATILTALVGLCNEKAIEQVVSYSRIYGDTTVDCLDEEDLENLVYFFKNFTISVDGTKGFDSAQVTAGGVDLSEIDTSSMESLKCKGLYFTGEVLDVDGICGGYNLNWAYTSADIASKSIIKELQ